MDSYTNVSGQCCGFCGRTVCAPSGRNCGCMQQDPMPLPSYSYDQNWNNSSMPMPTPSFRSDNMSDVMPDYTYMPAPAPRARSCPGSGSGPRSGSIMPQHFRWSFGTAVPGSNGLCAVAAVANHLPPGSGPYAGHHFSGVGFTI